MTPEDRFLDPELDRAVADAVGRLGQLELVHIGLVSRLSASGQ